MKDKVKFECGDCGCYFWVEDRNDFNCPNCCGDDCPNCCGNHTWNCIKCGGIVK